MLYLKVENNHHAAHILKLGKFELEGDHFVVNYWEFSWEQSIKFV